MPVGLPLQRQDIKSLDFVSVEGDYLIDNLTKVVPRKYVFRPFTRIEGLFLCNFFNMYYQINLNNWRGGE